MPEHQFPISTTAEDASLLAKAIVDTVREPLLVLDSDLQIVVASRSFYSTFELDRERAEGGKIYDLDGGVWDIPDLRLLLERIVPEHAWSRRSPSSLRRKSRSPAAQLEQPFRSHIQLPPLVS